MKVDLVNMSTDDTTVNVVRFAFMGMFDKKYLNKVGSGDPLSLPIAFADEKKVANFINTYIQRITVHPWTRNKVEIDWSLQPLDFLYLAHYYTQRYFGKAPKVAARNSDAHMLRALLGVDT